MARWLEQVRAQIPESPGGAPTEPTKGASVGFVGSRGGIFRKKQALSETNEKPAQDLVVAIRFARSEAELDGLVEEIQAEFEASRLSQEQAERLAALTMDTARQLAQGLVNVPVGVL